MRLVCKHDVIRRGFQEVGLESEPAVGRTDELEVQLAPAAEGEQLSVPCEAGRNDGNSNLVPEARMHHGAEDQVTVGRNDLRDQLLRL